MEHRALWTGLAVTLIAIGAGGFLGFLVTLRSADPPRDVDWNGIVSLLSYAFVLVGLAMIGWILRSLHREKEIRIHLNKLLREGLEIRQNALAEADYTKLDDWESKAKTWAETAYAYLSDNLPEYSSTFYVEDEGQRLAFSGNRQLRWISEWLDRRTARLSAILLKV